MAHLIDKDAVIAEIERQQKKLCVLSQSNEVELRKNAAIQNGVYCSFLSFLNTLEVKEADLESNDPMDTEVDDSNISCNCTSCSVHTDCKYFNPEKENNVKHCFGGVPMQLKYKKVQSMASKEVDLEKEYKDFIKSDNGRSMFETAKHFFTLGLKVNNEKEK